MRSIKFVSLRLCGIILILNISFLTLEIVKETPLIAIDPFSIKYFEKDLSTLKITTQVLSSINICKTLPVVSVWT